MKRIKLSITVLAAVAVAGVAGAGSVFIGGQNAGTFTGDVTLSGGDIHFASANINGSGGVPPDPNQEPPPNDPPPGDPPADPPPANCANVPTVAATRVGTTAFPTYPMSAGHYFDFQLSDGEYVAVKFTAPSGSRAGSMVIGQADPPYWVGTYTLAISECPGDFTQTVEQGQCKFVGSASTYWWATPSFPGSNNAAIACILQPGQTYYMNIIFASGPNLSVDGCPTSYCRQRGTWNNL